MNALWKAAKLLRMATDLALSALIVVLLGGMVLLAAAQIVMRNLFSYSLYSGDELLQLALLWLVMAGAVAATMRGEHIRINVLERYIPGSLRPWLQAVLHGFTAAVCGILTWHAARFVFSSSEYGDVLLGNVPAWVGQAVMPAGFGLLALHYAGCAIKPLLDGWCRRVPTVGT